MDSRSEDIEQASKEVPVGEWVRPFANYDNIKPFIGKNGISNHFSKTSEFHSPGIGRWAISMVWDKTEPEDTQRIPEIAQQQVLVIMPNGKARVVREYEISNLQEQFETRLMDTFVTIDNGDDLDRIDEPSGYLTVLKLSSGEELISDEIILTSGDWQFNNQIFTKLYIPDSQNIAESIELKLEKIGEKTHV